MTNSETGSYREAYVWCWLPGTTEPVVAGKLTRAGQTLVFNYGQSFLERRDAIALYEPELPLNAGVLPLLGNLTMPGCLRDAAPDAWGRRVLMHRHPDRGEPDELTCLLESGSDRIGALDFQLSPTEYVPRQHDKASLSELLDSAERVTLGKSLTPALDQALAHGTSIGGARPKVLIEENDRKFIAKFPVSTDLTDVVKAEFVAMRLARHAGLTVAPVSLVKAGGKDVLLIERFDRQPTGHGWQRRIMVSGLTLLQLDEMMARYASYQDLAEIFRHQFDHPRDSLRELFTRLVFNILCGNTDDHARNHSAFWDGHRLSLTPAYDLCPQPRTGNEASQAMLIQGQDRMSRISGCLASAAQFQLSYDEAMAVVADQIEAIGAHWQDVCALAGLGQTDRRVLWGRAFLNPYGFEDLAGPAAVLREQADELRARWAG